jgi:ubiquinone/menaquinone biosynthesis C-methylase UbiE
MPTAVRSSRLSLIVAWAAASFFILGFFSPLVGAWTGAILGTWFVGTQKPWRGFLWMTAVPFVPSLIFGWRSLFLAGPQGALQFVGWTLVAIGLGVLPFTFHRLTSPRLPGLLATLPLPLAAAAMRVLVLPLLPAAVMNHSNLVQSQQADLPLMQLGAIFGIGAIVFLVLWFAATLVWMWNHEFRASRIRLGGSLFAAAFVIAMNFGLYRQVKGFPLPSSLPLGMTFAWICLGCAAVLTLFAVLNPERHRAWADRRETLAHLQSPVTGNPLHVVTENGRETLVSSSGERFPIRNGIPTFLKPEDLTGDNGKYNHLYETIGGFYDDTQRFFGAFRGLSVDSYFLNYMSLLDVKPGDSVLESSVGTGLNFKYLPAGVKLTGLDLSPEMLVNCQANMRRWGMDADLFLGNAEALPFADCTFDVVYNAGAINFFNDRAKAIREMIRVAKPGSLIMVEDETEEYVKSTYENIPFTSSFYSDRDKPVTVPVDLVPPEMEDIHVDMLKEGKFYAITFRKPVACQVEVAAQ